jgi:enoyl-CoA hydratase/carnithine racemase
MDQEAIVVRDAGGVRTIALARPEAGNALTEAMAARLHDELSRAAGDVEVRALVLTGTGAAFCAGDLLLASATVDARRAHELGLLTEVVADDELEPAAARLAGDALRRAPQSYGLTKRLLLLAASADLQSSMAAETIAQSLLVRTDDHREGVRAARERRPPEFTGR